MVIFPDKTRTFSLALPFFNDSTCSAKVSMSLPLQQAAVSMAPVLTSNESPASTAQVSSTSLDALFTFYKRRDVRFFSFCDFTPARIIKRLKRKWQDPFVSGEYTLSPSYRRYTKSAIDCVTKSLRSLALNHLITLF